MPPFERACSYCLGMVQVWWGMEKYGRPYLRVFVSRARVMPRSARRAGVGGASFGAGTPVRARPPQGARIRGSGAAEWDCGRLESS